jgi:iron complex outermembrane receptor protein
MGRIALRAVIACAVASASGGTVLAAERGGELQEIIIIAPYGTGLDSSLVPANVQSATAEEIERAQTLDLSDFLNRNLGSVSINHAQNNPLQPDVNFRGFTASPLLGLSPGLTVYENGVRINEPFGDTINWDVIPLSAVSSLQMFAGTNPLFGLNTLGGALSMKMKTGFDYERTAGEAYGGSFERRGGTLQSGGNNGRWGYYANVDYFEEDGWRDFSRSEALRFYGSVSMRTLDSGIDVSYTFADTSLRGNGAAPVELLAIDRRQVFTHPDITENKLSQIIAEGTHRLSERVELGANVFYRNLDTDTFNGDGTIFEECVIGGREFLVEESFADLNADGECDADAGDAITPVVDLTGSFIEAELDEQELNAINNIGRRSQENYGASLQLDLQSGLAGRDNQLLIGVAFNQGRSTFHSMLEVAQLLEDRSTSRTGIFAEEFLTNVNSDTRSASAYFANTLRLSSRAALTLAGRFNDTRVELKDRSGQTPELNGKHDFSRFNPAIGLTFQVTPGSIFYASYGESARAPTPVELACASEDAPCNLPNAFLADPPLDQVVAKSFEIGTRGQAGNGLRWHIGAFHTVNHDDILFQTVGGPQANVGFFDNVSDTRRAGIELALSQHIDRFSWLLQYSFIDAAFQDAFIVNSPNHPLLQEAPDDERIVGEGKLQVSSGSRIPGIPQHQANLRFDYDFNDRLSVGADVVMRSGVYLRGDEINALGRTDGYSVLNLRAQYRLGRQFTLFARIENVLDEEYETFGLLGEPDEVFEDFEDVRFLGAGPPFGAWLGFKVTL